MQVREEDQALAQPPVLGLDRLLHLEHELGALPHLVDRDDPRADALVVGVGERAADAGALLDRDVVPAVDQLERAGGRQRDAVLVRLDLLGDADPHAARKPTDAGRRPLVERHRQDPDGNAPRRDRHTARARARRTPPRCRRAARRRLRAGAAAAAPVGVRPHRRSSRSCAHPRRRHGSPSSSRAPRSCLGYPREDPAQIAWLGPHRAAASASCKRRSPAPASSSRRHGLAREDVERIIWTSSVGIHVTPLGEWALFGILALTKGLPRLEADKRARHWAHYPVDEVRGTTVLIAGLGEIGREVARLAEAFGMDVLVDAPQRRRPRRAAAARGLGRDHAPADRRDARHVRPPPDRPDEAGRDPRQHRPRPGRRRGRADRRAPLRAICAAPRSTSSRPSRCRPTARCGSSTT